MKLTNLSIKDLITPEAKLTFLVGAGCSVDSPSCLPAGRAMMDAIIDFTCAESEIDKIKIIEELRFEQLVEIVRDRLDKQLKIIDYYGQCDKPNLQHLFLAEMIRNGHFVMTTNFDFLIEYALQVMVPKEEIKVVITKEDFEKFSNPQELYSNGLKTLYKIHGSTMNILKPEGQRDTRDSLIATIQAFGSNKEGENVFQLEYFKKSLFENITKERSLVVMGYSGSDDFDIVPTLKVLEHIQDIIWINYSEKINIGDEEIHEINANTSQVLDELDKDLRKVTQILLEIWQMKNVEHVYRVDVNTKDMVKNLLKSEIKLSTKDFSINSRNWLENNLDVPSEMMKYYIPYKIYNDFDIYDDAMICSEKVLHFAKNSNHEYSEATALNNIGTIFMAKGEYPEAIKRYEKALQIAEKLGVSNIKAIVLDNIGSFYREKGEYPEAIKRYEKALQIAKKLGDLEGKACYLNDIGWIYYKQGDHPEALKRYEMALRTFEQLGLLGGKANVLNSIGWIYENRGDYDKTLDLYEEALNITEQLGDSSGKVSCLIAIGNIYAKKEKYSKTLKLYEEALKIAENIGNLGKKATCLRYISAIYFKNRDYDESLKNIEEALKIDEQLGDIDAKAQCFRNIGEIYREQGEYNKAIRNFEEALSNEKKSGYLAGQVDTLSCIATIYYDQENYDEALKRFEETLKIAERLGNLEIKARSLNNIGEIFRIKGNYSKALKRFEESLEITDQMGHVEGRTTCLYNIGLIHYKQGNYPRALKRFEEVLELSEDLGMRYTRLIDIGAICYAQGDYPTALRFFKESLDISEQLKTFSNIALSLWWVGSIYGELDETSKALQNLERALEIYEQLRLENESHKVREAILILKS